MDGVLIEDGPPEHFFTAPTHERTKQFLAKILRIPRPRCRSRSSAHAGARPVELTLRVHYEMQCAAWSARLSLSFRFPAGMLLPRFAAGSVLERGTSSATSSFRAARAVAVGLPPPPADHVRRDRPGNRHGGVHARRADRQPEGTRVVSGARGRTPPTWLHRQERSPAETGASDDLACLQRVAVRAGAFRTPAMRHRRRRSPSSARGKPPTGLESPRGA